MISIFKRLSWVVWCSVFVVGTNLLLYSFITISHSWVGFDKLDYHYSAHHYFADPRYTDGKFNLVRALGIYDAQWYLKIAETSYPKHPANLKLGDKQDLDGLTYAFFPLFPVLIALVNNVVHNVELAALLTVNILGIVNAISAFYITTKFFSSAIAKKTVILLFLFPFSIFWRSYYAESLQLLLLLWFGYFFMRNRYTLAATLLGLLHVVKAGSMLITIPFVVSLGMLVKHKTTLLPKAILCLILIAVPFLGWLWYNYAQTNNMLYFGRAETSWYPPFFIMYALLYNIATIFLFPILPLHSYNLSKIEVLFIVAIGLLLWKSYKYLPKRLWWISAMLWLMPLLTKDLSSFTRYQTVSYPLFIYLAVKLKGPWFVITMLVFMTSMFFTSLYFINWYWVG